MPVGEADKAARQFELALDLDPNLAAAHYAMGVLCQHRNRIPKALKHWHVTPAPAKPKPEAKRQWQARQLQSLSHYGLLLWNAAECRRGVELAQLSSSRWNSTD